MVSVARTWLICGYHYINIGFICSKTMVNFIRVIIIQLS